MSIKIVVPEMGESVVEATVSQWFKHEGDTVTTGETLVELETDKVNVQVAAERTGTLARIEHKAGEDVKVGDALGIIEEAATPVPVAPAPARVPAQTTPATATPVAERMAQELGIDLSQVAPSDPSGRITKEDVQAYAGRQKETTPPTERPVPAAAAQPMPQEQPAQESRPVREERVRMSRRRQTIARRLVEAQHSAAMLTTFNEVDMGAVMDIRKRRKESFAQRHGVGLGFMSFFVKASIGALKAFPMLNAEIDGDDIILKRYYDIGIAVGAAEGLVVPVLRNADQMTFAQIEMTVKTLAQKAQENTLSLEDLRGGTFTITNGGVFGSLLSTPILNTPQVGILGMHKIEERPVALNGQVVIRPMMYVALSYDHRLVDGREAVQFLVRVKELIEDPETLLIEG